MWTWLASHVLLIQKRPAMSEDTAERQRCRLSAVKKLDSSPTTMPQHDRRKMARNADKTRMATVFHRFRVRYKQMVNKN